MPKKALHRSVILSLVSSIVLRWASVLLAACSYAAVSFAQQAPIPVPSPETQNSSPNYFDAIESHFDRLIHYSMDRYGRTRSGMWVSSIDIHTNELPNDETLANSEQDPTLIPGAHFYWDQPMLLAAFEVSKRSGCKCYADSADSYIRSYLHMATSQDAEIPLGDNVYFDVHKDLVRRRSNQQRLYRFHTPAWELLWAHDTQRTESTINAFAESRLNNSPKNPNSSLYSHAIAIESLAWLSKRKKASIDSIAEKAADVISNIEKPHADRSAVAFWGKCISRAGLKSQANILVSENSTKPNDIQDPRMQIAWLLNQQESVLASALTDGFTPEHVEMFGKAVTRLKDDWTAQDYAKAIRFYENASTILKKPALHNRATEVSDDAIAKLFVSESSMFRSRVGVDRCDAADGIGWLFLALMQIDGSDATKVSALGF